MTDQHLSQALRNLITLLGSPHLSTLAADTGQTESRIRQVLHQMHDVHVAPVTLVCTMRPPATKRTVHVPAVSSCRDAPYVPVSVAQEPWGMSG